MVKIGGVISPPCDALSVPSTMVSEKVKVATPHQAEPGTDQPDGPVAQVVGLPESDTRAPHRVFGRGAWCRLAQSLFCLRLRDQIRLKASPSSTRLA
jgi:hypothetical protein